MKTLADAWDEGATWAHKFPFSLDAIKESNPYRNNAIEAARERVIEAAKRGEFAFTDTRELREAVRALLELENKV